MITERELRRRKRLLRQARRGDVGALCILRERYHLRLPLIEARSRYTFPWSPRAAGSRKAKGNAG